jgi:AmiR/NasT family two-component response regulator
VRVLVVDESPERARIVRERLHVAGHEIAASLASLSSLFQTIEETQPDAIMVGTGLAVAWLDELQRLRTQLEERKVVERAKGMLMKTRGMDEEAAYRLLRKFAMDRKLKLAEVARQLVDAADLLGA